MGGLVKFMTSEEFQPATGDPTDPRTWPAVPADQACHCPIYEPCVCGADDRLDLPS